MVHSTIQAIYTPWEEINKEFRKFAEVSIELVERAIDVMNTTTHKINADKHLAKVCVISTISAIRIIKLIREVENQNRQV